MSFGASPSDIIIVVKFARQLYRNCKSAGGEYLEISREVRGLHTVLRHLKYEVEAPESVLNRDRSLYARELAPVIGDCDFTLRELDELLLKYDRLRDGSVSPGVRLWDKVRFGSTELDQLGILRMKLINHKTNITVFLDTVQLHESARISTTLDNHGGQLDIILDKVDGIAARMGQRAGSLMTTYDDDDKEVWKQFRRELVAEGFSSDVLQQHKDVLRAYIRQIDQNGLLDEMPSTAPALPAGSFNAQRWLDGVQTPVATQGPPSFDSLNTASEDASMKELVISEENMKFPQSMKAVRAQPESAPVNIDPGKQLVVSRDITVAGQKEGIGVTAKAAPNAPVPKLITSVEKTSSDTGVSKGIPEMSLIVGATISTADLVLADEYALDHPRGLLIAPSSYRSDRGSPRNSFNGDRDLMNSPSGSPHSTRSQASFADENAPRAITYRSKSQQLAPPAALYGTSPSRSGTLPIPSKSSFDHSGDRYSSSPNPRSSTSTLAPDSQGNEIPPDAKWTRIRRSLISPEVLDQDRRRYEARPDFVAILGVLSRHEIEDLAARSQALREARHARNAGISKSEIPPPQPPRPMQKPPVEKKEKHVSWPDERDSLTDSDDTSSSEDERDRHRDRGTRTSKQGHVGYSPRSRDNEFAQFPSVSAPLHYAQHYGYGGQPSAQQPWSPGPTSPQYAYAGAPAPMPFPGYLPQQSQYVPDEPRTRPTGLPDKGKSSKKTSGAVGNKKKNSRWGENLTAAGIGGAAVSLLNVLSEAAEGL